MKNLHFLIKPASSACNLRCKYCFYTDIAENRSVKHMGMMQRDTVQNLLNAAFSTIEPNGNIHFAFQGGEPTLVGLPFFKDFVEAVEKTKSGKVSVSYSMQTNGTRLDDDWVSFLKENDFLVGVSLDGYKDLHNFYRVNTEGNGSWGIVNQAFQKLVRGGVRTNILCVVTAQCAKHPAKAYNEFKKMGGKHMQFIPCIDPIEENRGKASFSLTPHAYGEFLCKLFDLWYDDWTKGCYHSIRLFEDYVNILLGHLDGTTCATCGQCGSYLVVEGDGSVYPCDFFVLDRWRMGKLGEHTLKDMLGSQQAKAFIQWGSNKPEECKSCRWRSLCNGGCKNDWERSAPPKNYFCESFKTFFTYAETRLCMIAKKELQARRLYHGSLREKDRKIL